MFSSTDIKLPHESYLFTDYLFIDYRHVTRERNIYVFDLKKMLEKKTMFNAICVSIH